MANPKIIQGRDSKQKKKSSAVLVVYYYLYKFIIQGGHWSTNYNIRICWDQVLTMSTTSQTTPNNWKLILPDTEMNIY